MRYALIIVIALFLPACSLIESIKATAAKTSELAAKTTDLAEKATVLLDGATTILADTTSTLANHKAEADTNDDGETSTAEWMAYLLSVLGLGGGAVAEGRRRVGVRNAESDARKSAAEARIAHLEKAATA